MYEAQVGDTFESKTGKRVFISQRNTLEDMVQIEYEDSGRTRWISTQKLWEDFTFVD